MQEVFRTIFVILAAGALWLVSPYVLIGFFLGIHIPGILCFDD